MNNKFDELVLKFREQQKTFQQQLRDAFKESIREFFEAFPEVTVIRWTQFTPYFNDGEECIFEVNSPVFSNAPEEDIADGNVNVYGEYEGDDESVWMWGENVYDEYKVGPSQEAIDAMDAIADMIQSEEFEGLAKSMFGNHVLVTVTRDGIDVSDYDHD